MSKRMSNKKVKASQLSLFQDLHCHHVNNKDKVRSEWAFDRLRLFEDKGMHRTKLSHPHISKVSLTADQLRGVK